MRMTAALLAALALLGACDGPEARKPRPPAAPTLPLSFEQKTADGEVALTLDRRISPYPALHNRLYTEGKRELISFMASAKADRQQLRDSQIPPYDREVGWAVVARTDRLVSLRQSWSEYTGGAHPNHGSTTLLWSKGAEAPVLQSALFRPDADYGALDAALCAAAKGEKAARMGAAAAEADDWECPKWKDSRAVLVPSTVKGRAGGLMFLFDPYVLGPYVEGDYEVLVPQARFRAALAPAWAGEFEGDPRIEESAAAAP